MATKLLDLSDKRVWHDYLTRIERKDIYFTPEYCEIYERNGEGKAQLFIYEEGENFVYYPYLLRNLSELPHLRKFVAKHGALYDISTPYGYGGPITNLNDKTKARSLLIRFSIAFHDHCKETNIISEFIRFHPLLQNHLIFAGSEPVYIRDTVHVDLTRDYDEIWANYDSKNRNRIRKAMSYDLRIVHRDRGELHNFLKLYYSTMTKNNAREYYYFSEAFFQHTCELLLEKAELIDVVTKDDKAIMSALFICGDDMIHYHLSGSDPDQVNLSANNFILDYTVKWAKERHFKSLHLGGGYTGNDSLYRFKKRFNKKGDLPFYIGKQIHHPVIYEEIALEMMKAEIADYFPIYRHPDLFLTSVDEGEHSLLART
ncbi:peptidoglycan bridge formation glycyltransferase FemA/FemB family protein [Bacillus sp. NTK071]|uniref:peptidoglycan bridge formation glycyltransferase FemA/FemB family protein n=1 Tax=Bacillus sp. NTK071 TaxID=2802175 RepID=UPI001A8BFA6B|nr:peptidoglycan bridge formation glycyltransferase FemA/FemB family protein [Bacillus sp. NTK071]MBN8209771.1 peptidoglycan bridge formation glycyltransferase FemA/FemB family protein [Bacillus sp. NTK071]